MPPSQLLLLALPSLALWSLILWQRRQLQGWRVVLAFVVAVAVYALLRANAIGAVMAEIGGDRPYLMRHPLVPLGSGSPQEIVGWGVAIGLAWAIAERVAALAGMRAGPSRLALLSFFVMTAISAAVEGAAIAAGWWRWTLPSASTEWNVPSIALLDWGFVALDFLLPLLMWLSHRPLWQRVLALGIFPLHFLAHAAAATPAAAWPWGIHTSAHIGILAAVAAAAFGERSDVRRVAVREPLWWLAPCLALALALWTAVIAALNGHAPGITSAPLALLALALLMVERQRARVVDAAAAIPLSTRRLWATRSALFVVCSGMMLLGLWPAAEQTRALQVHLDNAATGVAQGDLRSAREALLSAQAIDPQHSTVATLLALVALREGRDQDAQDNITRALQTSPNSRTALQLAAIVALRQRQTADAHALALRGRSLYPDDLVLRYLESASSGNVSTGTLLALAGPDPTTLAELAAAAQLLGDRAMAAACRDAQARLIPGKIGSD